MKPIAALLGAATLATVATFTFFGGYWYELLRHNNKEDNE